METEELTDFGRDEPYRLPVAEVELAPERWPLTQQQKIHLYRLCRNLKCRNRARKEKARQEILTLDDQTVRCYAAWLRQIAGQQSMTLSKCFTLAASICVFNYIGWGHIGIGVSILAFAIAATVSGIQFSRRKGYDQFVLTVYQRPGIEFLEAGIHALDTHNPELQLQLLQTIYPELSRMSEDELMALAPGARRRLIDWFVRDIHVLEFSSEISRELDVVLMRNYMVFATRRVLHQVRKLAECANLYPDDPAIAEAVICLPGIELLARERDGRRQLVRASSEANNTSELLRITLAPQETRRQEELVRPAVNPCYTQTPDAAETTEVKQGSN